MIREEEVKEIFNSNFNDNPVVIKRLFTGLCHYVYYVEDDKKNNYIVRISDVKNKNLLHGSIYWISMLNEFNLPIPKILAKDINCSVPYLILNYIPGDDLGNVYNDLSEDDKVQIAKKLVSIQKKLEKLRTPYDSRFGYLSSFEDKNYKTCWLEVIREHLDRSRKRIMKHSYFDILYVDKVNEKIDKYLDYLNNVKAIPFFHDATTKNVLIEEGKFTGIIDLDSICFGDKLYQIALTKMSLLSNNYDTNYIKYWIKELDINNEETKILNLYTLVFCVDFMSEIGMKFNKEKVIKPNKEKIDRLKMIHNNIYDIL